jgi:ribosomal protein S4E
MKRIFACFVVLFLFSAVAFTVKAEEKMISGKVTAVDAKAGSVKIKDSDGKEVSLKGTEEQLKGIKVNDEVEVVVDDSKIVSIMPVTQEEPGGMGEVSPE